MRTGFHLTPFWSPTDRSPTAIIDEAIEVVRAASTMASVSTPVIWMAIVGLVGSSPILISPTCEAHCRHLPRTIAPSRPGMGVCGTGLHSHPDHVAIPLTAAKVKVVGEDGKTFIANLKAGEAFWDPAATHIAENIGGSGARAVIVEIKDRDWKPSTG